MIMRLSFRFVSFGFLLLLAAELSANDLIVEKFDIKRTTINIITKPHRGISIAELLSQQNDESGRFMFINGPIFEIGYQPMGLFIVDGIELNPINTKQGPGNFYFSNGVFSISGNSINVEYRHDYLCNNLTPDFAIQSGPLLIHDSVINHKLNPKVTSMYTRSAIGVTADENMFVAYSTIPMTLYNFTRTLLDTHKVKSALFLDGTIVSSATRQQRFNTQQKLYSIIHIIESE